MSHTEAPGDNVDHEAHMRDVIADVRQDRAEIKRLTAEVDRVQHIANHYAHEAAAEGHKRTAFLDWLKAREQWLTNEISGGGNWEHLNTRRSECAYIRERFERLSSGSTAPKE